MINFILVMQSPDTHELKFSPESVLKLTEVNDAGISIHLIQFSDRNDKTEIECSATQGIRVISITVSDSRLSPLC